MPKRFGSKISTSDAITIIAAPDADAGAEQNAGIIAVANSNDAFARGPEYDLTAEVYFTGTSTQITELEWGREFAVIITADAPVSLEGLTIPYTINEITYLIPEDRVSTGTLTINVDQLATLTLELVADPKIDLPAGDFIITLNPGTVQEQQIILTRPESNEELYTFTTHTFTDAGFGARWDGPPITNLRSTYSSTSWASSDLYFKQGWDTGVQLWTVPATGEYTIVLRGAGGGRSNGWSQNGGPGALMQGTFNLEINDKLGIVVGQAGQNNYYDAGGGGGSFVALYPGGDTSSAPVLLIAAAGGGGGAPSGFSGGGLLGNTNSGRIENQGSNTSWATGGVNGLGGGNGSTAGGGGGWLGAGGSGWGGARNNGGGVINDPKGNSQQADGGFGGGGAGGGTNGSGGGGGYGGGASSPWSYRGGGGGSYYNTEYLVADSYSGTTGGGSSGQVSGSVVITKVV